MKRTMVAVLVMVALAGCKTEDDRQQDLLDSIARQGELAQACRDAGGDYLYDSWSGNHCEFPPGPEGGSDD